MKLKCEFCEFRGFPSNLRMHMMRHTKPVSNENKLEFDDSVSNAETTQLTPGGRIRRHAASKASIKVANAIKQLKTGELLIQ